MRFRVYYGDGSTYEGDGSDESAWATPQIDVQVINIEIQGGCRKLFAKGFKAYFCWREGEWCLSDDAGYWDYMMYLPGPKKVLFGRSMMNTADFWRLVDRATKEGLG